MRSDLVPKFYTTLREGYTFQKISADFLSGLTVAIAALPMSMAFAIASGTSPERGLYTAIIAGFLVSFLGGSRHQIGGPTGAFIVVIYGIIERFGYDGLVIATLMAGLMLILLGLLRMGVLIRYIPGPLITGFTAGIGVIIASSQVKDFFGLDIEKLPSAFVEKWAALLAHIQSFNPEAVFVAASSLMLIILLKRYAPKLPSLLLAIIYGSAVTYIFGLHIETIESRFGGLTSDLPSLHIPGISFEQIRLLFPAALTIAFLAGIESLLSAVVADGMTGRRHRSNAELVAQGVANISSVLMGGIPATGAIARTATNIKSGGRTPLAGIFHASFILLFILFFAPLAKWIPLASLSAILMIVAWNMSEIHKFMHLFRAPRTDVAVLLTTFLLTVFVDLTVGVGFGLILALILFVRNIVETTAIKVDLSKLERDPTVSHRKILKDEENADSIQIFEINGPLFFGIASRLGDALDALIQKPKVFIVRFEQVMLLDATGAYSLRDFIETAQAEGVEVIISGASANIQTIMQKLGVLQKLNQRNLVPNLGSALKRAKEIMQV